MSVIKYGRDIPTFVRRFRKEAGYSQKELAELLGVHPQYVSNVERRCYTTYINFASRLLAIVEPERKKFLIDLISDASAGYTYKKLLKKLALKPRKKRR